MSIRSDALATYTDAWGLPEYSTVSPGEQYAEVFTRIVGRSCRVIDAGAGSGKGAVALRRLGHQVVMLDITDEGLSDDAKLMMPFYRKVLWDDLIDVMIDRETFDWVYCTDVLEHVEEALVGLCVARMLAIVSEGVFLTVDTRPDHFGLWVGTPLHQTVRDFSWWKRLLEEIGVVREARDLCGPALFVVEPKA